METGREELKFKSHYIIISDLEQVVRREIEHSTSLTNDMQVCLAKLHTAYCLPCVCVCVQGVLQKLAREVERNIQLNSEVKDGKNGKQSTQTHTHICCLSVIVWLC